MRAFMAACRSQTTTGFAHARCRYSTLKSSCPLSRIQKAAFKRRCINERHSLTRQTAHQNSDHCSSFASAYATSKSTIALTPEWIRMFNTDAQQKLSASEEKVAIVVNADAESEPPKSTEQLEIEQKYHDLVNQMDIYIKNRELEKAYGMFKEVMAAESAMHAEIEQAEFQTKAMAKGVAALLAKYGPLSGVQQHSILDRLAENGHELEPDLVNNLLHKLLVEDDKHRVRKIMGGYGSDPLILDQHVSNDIQKMLHFDDDAMEDVRLAELKRLCQAGAYGSAWALYDLLDKKGVATARMRNAVLASDFSKPATEYEEMLRKMRAEGVPVARQCLHTLIRIHQRDGNVDAANEVYEVTMAEFGVPPNDATEEALRSSAKAMNLATGRRIISQLNSAYPEEAWRLFDSLWPSSSPDTRATLQHAFVYMLVRALDNNDYSTAYGIFSRISDRYHSSLSTTPLLDTHTPIAFDFDALLEASKSRNQRICAGILLKAGSEPSTETYNNLVSLFSSKAIYADTVDADAEGEGDTAEVETYKQKRLRKRRRQERIRETRTRFYWRLKDCLNNNDAEGGLAVYDFLVQNSLLHPDHVPTVLKLHNSAKDMRKCMHSFEADGGKLSARMFQVYVDRLLTEGRDEKARKVIEEEMPKYKLIPATELLDIDNEKLLTMQFYHLKNLIDRDHIEDAWKFFKRMDELDRVQVLMVPTVLSCAVCNSSKRMYQVFDIARRHGYTIDGSMYQYLIRELMFEARMDEARHLIEDVMPKAGIHIGNNMHKIINKNIVEKKMIWTSVLKKLISERKIKDAWAMYDRVKAVPHAVDQEICTTMLTACWSEDLRRKYFQQVLDLGIEPDVYMFTINFRSQLIEADFKAAKETKREMVKRGIVFDDVQRVLASPGQMQKLRLNRLVGLINIGEIGEAWGVFAKLESRQKNQTENWLVMTKACQDPAMARGLIDLMRQSGKQHQYADLLYTRMLELLALEGDCEGAREVLDNLPSDITPTETMGWIAGQNPNDRVLRGQRVTTLYRYIQQDCADYAWHLYTRMFLNGCTCRRTTHLMQYALPDISESLPTLQKRNRVLDGVPPGYAAWDDRYPYGWEMDEAHHLVHEHARYRAAQLEAQARQADGEGDVDVEFDPWEWVPPAP